MIFFDDGGEDEDGSDGDALPLLTFLRGAHSWAGSLWAPSAAAGELPWEHKPPIGHQEHDRAGVRELKIAEHMPVETYDLTANNVSLPHRGGQTELLLKPWPANWTHFDINSLSS